MPIGKVWLVGAGPGDAGLLTLRGREVMEQADAIVFDRLVGDGVLAMMPERAEKINVGKEGGRHPVPQREIEKILVEKALKGKNVVRLKGGDPFVFGRGGEEIEALKKENIELRGDRGAEKGKYRVRGRAGRNVGDSRAIRRGHTGHSPRPRGVAAHNHGAHEGRRHSRHRLRRARAPRRDAALPHGRVGAA